MNNKIVVYLLLTVFLLTASVAQAQQPEKTTKIGWLGIRPPTSGRFEMFRQELRLLGYVEGKNIAFEYRYAEDKLDRLPALADDLVRLKVDLFVTTSAAAALAAKKATKTTPIIFLGSGVDPVVAGLVESLARPGSNLTGFTNFGAVLAGKRLELLKETVPKLSRVAVLWDPRAPSSAQEWKESQLPARELGLQLYSIEAGSADKFERAFQEVFEARGQGLAVTSGPINNSNPKRIADLAIRHRLPAIYHREDFVARGGLMSYSADQTETYKRAAVLVDKILKGAKPADLPVEQPKKFELVINLKAAKEIGLTIPDTVLFRADKVIK